MWSVLPSGFACVELTGKNKFTHFRMTEGCLVWHSGTKDWHGAFEYCKALGDGIKLALPANSLQRVQWGWRTNNFWGGARRQVGSLKAWKSYVDYGDNTNVVQDPTTLDEWGKPVWDDDEPSGSHKDDEIQGRVEEDCLQIRGNWRWNDESCSDKNSFYCYMPPAC